MKSNYMYVCLEMKLFCIFFVHKKYLKIEKYIIAIRIDIYKI